MTGADRRSPGPTLRLAHTASLGDGELRTGRALLDEAFDGDFTDDDFDHALGGMHALVSVGGEVVAHGSVVTRRLLHRGRALRTGYVEAVAVRPHHRGAGHGGSVMAALEEVLTRAYVLGALSASDMAAGFYGARSWQLWTGTLSVIPPYGGIRRTIDHECSVYVLPVAQERPSDGDLACEWRNGDVW